MADAVACSDLMTIIQNDICSQCRRLSQAVIPLKVNAERFLDDSTLWTFEGGSLSRCPTCRIIVKYMQHAETDGQLMPNSSASMTMSFCLIKTEMYLGGVGTRFRVGPLRVTEERLLADAWSRGIVGLYRAVD